MSERQARWYFGGLASAGAVFFTHPLDLMKVNLQTQQEKLSIIGLTKKILKERGIFAFYSGLSASVLRQMTYSLARFGMYEVGKDFIETKTLFGKITLALVSGVVGGLVGTPADMVNVRMQNDVKLSPEARRNYKHAFDAMTQVYRKEGTRMLFSGTTPAVLRGGLMTIGQIAFYDQIKTVLLEDWAFKDDVRTHFVASLGAGTIATFLTQPIDVIKTRMMNAKRGEYKGMVDVARYTALTGPMAFFKGFIPAFIRIGPHTIILFMLLEQLRINFGILPESKAPKEN